MSEDPYKPPQSVEKGEKLGPEANPLRAQMEAYSQLWDDDRKFVESFAAAITGATIAGGYWTIMYLAPHLRSIAGGAWTSAAVVGILNSAFFLIPTLMAHRKWAAGPIILIILLFGTMFLPAMLKNGAREMVGTRWIITVLISLFVCFRTWGNTCRYRKLRRSVGLR